jgi:hypothetical protein
MRLPGFYPAFGKENTPHCVNTIDESVALIRENRAAWLAAQPSK